MTGSKSYIRTAWNPQPCGACGEDVEPGAHRRPGATWWHSTPTCRAERNRRRWEARNRRAGQAARTPGVCERCGRSYYRMPGSTSPYRLCSRRPCYLERTRRSKADQRARARLEAMAA